MTTKWTPPTPEILGWLPGPLLTDQHRDDAVGHVVLSLRHLARPGHLRNPRTWDRVADQLGIAMIPYQRPGESNGRLRFNEDKDTWEIWFNAYQSPDRVAAVKVHELGHWFFREHPAQWLCGEEIVYYYEGPVDDERHKLARRVERLIVPLWHEAPAVGLFGEKD